MSYLNQEPINLTILTKILKEMKRKSTLFISFVVCGMVALQASEDLLQEIITPIDNTTSQTTSQEIKTQHIIPSTYIMLSPLDTTSLPDIPTKKLGGDAIRKALNKDLVWEKTQREFQRKNFSEKNVYRMMHKMYRYTHKHYVAIPCAYWSSTPQGDSLLVSGKIYLPKCRELKGIVVANHHTIGSDIEAPSSSLFTESIFTMKGYAVIMPDYVGYGLSRDKVHPYLHWRSAAQTAIDLLNCMPELLDYYGYSYPTDVVVEGYSQGAAVALGVTRMIEENQTVALDNHKTIKWSVRKLYAGAGPYDPAETYTYSIEQNMTGIPAAIPLIILGFDDAYNLGIDMENFFLEPLLSHYEEWVLSKEYTVQEISLMMGSTRMSDLMTTESMDIHAPSSKTLYDALRQNSNADYNLNSPAYFLHSLDDQVVPLINSYNLQSQLSDTSKVFFDYGHYGSHLAASVPFMKYVYQDL